MDFDRQNQDLDRCHNRKEICKVYYSCTPGPRGPAGPSFNTYLMAYNNANATVGDNDSIPFNTTSLNSNITITPAGIITIPTAGQYLINWWINAKNNSNAAAILSADFNSLTPVGNTLASSNTAFQIGASNDGIITGTAIINAAANSTYNLVNSSGIVIGLAAVKGFANTITITRIN